uniref:Lens epithelial protein n=1 Tax=Anser cygnoides TaxID=8845 RepID=A0A8B9DLD5_ANSCY
MPLLRTAAARLPGAPRRAVRAAALPAPNGDSLGLRLGSWLLRVLRECAYLLLCSWCIRELLD